MGARELSAWSALHECPMGHPYRCRIQRLPRRRCTGGRARPGASAEEINAQNPLKQACVSPDVSATLCSIMISSIDTGHDPAELGELEQAVLREIWRGKEVTADQVRQQLEQAGRVLKESTIRTVLRRLEEKGYLAHRLDGRTFVYRAAEDGRSVAGRAVQRIVDRFCGGSVESLVGGMVRAEVLSERELQRLAEKIAQARAGTAKPK